jgi:hypothetical protein
LLFEGQWLLLSARPINASYRTATRVWAGASKRTSLQTCGRSVLRELTEETGLTEADLEHLTLRRMLTHNRPGEPLTVLFYSRRVETLRAAELYRRHLSVGEARGLCSLDIIETTGKRAAQTRGRCAQELARSGRRSARRGALRGARG